MISRDEIIEVDTLYDEVVNARERYIMFVNYYLDPERNFTMRLGSNVIKLSEDLKEKIWTYIEDQLYESLNDYCKKLDKYNRTLFTLYCNRYSDKNSTIL